MRVNLPGLLVEAHRNGAARIRVRVKGDKARRITLPVGQDHPDFLQHYHAARAGREWVPGKAQAVERSLDWLCGLYLDYLAKMVEAGQARVAHRSQKMVLYSNGLRKAAGHFAPESGPKESICCGEGVPQIWR